MVRKLVGDGFNPIVFCRSSTQPTTWLSTLHAVWGATKVLSVTGRLAAENVSTASPNWKTSRREYWLRLTAFRRV